MRKVVSLAVAAIAAAWMGFGDAQAATTNRTEEVIRPGFTLVKYVCDDNPCWRAYLMKVDLDTPGLRFDIGYPNGDEIGTTAKVSAHASALKTKLEAEFGTGKVLFQTGINCDFFGGDGYTDRLNIRNGEQLQTGYNTNVPNYGAGNARLYETTDGQFHMSDVVFSGSLSINGDNYAIGYVNTINVFNIASGVAVFTDGYLGTMPADGVEIEFDEAFAGGGITLAGKPFKVIGPISSGAKFSGRSAKRGALVGLSAGEQSAIAALAANTTGTLSWGLTGVEGTADVRNLAGVWLWVLRNGEYVPNDDQHEEYPTAKNEKGYPRTCMGLSAKNNQAVFFVNDGRQKDWSVHMTTAQVAALLLAEGCENAGQFDGGGSTTLWDSENGVENRPCGGATPGVEAGEVADLGEERTVAQTMFFSVIDSGEGGDEEEYAELPDGVICAAPDGTGDGSAWDKAASVADAVAAAGANGTVWLKEGVYTLAAGLATANAVSILGGFDGTEASAADRDPAARSVLDGGQAVDVILTLTASSGTYVFEQLTFSNAVQKAVNKSKAASSLTMRNCESVCNGTKSTGAVQGRGGYFGGTGAAELVIEHCVFSSNYDSRLNGSNDNSSGNGAYIDTWKSVTLNDVLFTDCGLKRTSHNGSSLPGRDQTEGWVVRIESAPFAFTNVRFLGNNAFNNGEHGGLVYVNGSCSGSSFDHCQWVGNQSAIFTDGGKGGLVRFGATGTFTFNHCTMAYNIFRKAICAGIRVDGASTTVNVRNSIIWGNFASKSYNNTCGEDVYIANNSSSVKFTNSLLSGTGDPYAYYPAGNGERVTKDDVSVCLDPQFATDLATVAAMSTKSTISTSDPASNGDSCNFKDDADLLSIDVHLKSQEGRWNGSAWVTDAVDSPAIDLGNATDDRSLEPAPNGKAPNAGVYGNTAEASKTLIVMGGFAGEVLVSQNDYTRPHLGFALGETTAPYQALVQFAYSDEQPADFGAETLVSGWKDGWKKVKMLAQNAAPGDAFDATTDIYFETGTTLWWRLAVTTSGGTVWREGSVTLTGQVPPQWGKGGGADVIHVWAEATGDGSGSDWLNAARDLGSALQLVSGTRTNIWVCGTVRGADSVLLAAAPTGAGVTVLGGFATATECSPDEIAEGARSTIDGDSFNAYGPGFSPAQGTGVTVKNLVITRCKEQGLSKTGKGDLTLENCLILTNGYYCIANLSGRGVYAAGDKSVSRLTIRDCEIVGNVEGQGDTAYTGAGLYVDGAKLFTMSNVLVAANRLPLKQHSGCPGRDVTNGGAVSIKDAVVDAKDVRFLGNNSGANLNCGNVMQVTGSANGSKFENCVWAGNQQCRYNDGPGNNSGTLVIGIGSGDTLELDKCTVAFNLGERHQCAGVRVSSGKVKVRNSIVAKNILGTNAGVAADFYRTGGTLDVDWSLVVSTNAPYSAGAIAWGEHMTYAEPLFATDDAALLKFISYNGTKSIPKMTGGGDDMYFSTASLDALLELDVHLKSGTGWTDETTGLLNKTRKENGRWVFSPAIDAGDPKSDCSLEPAPAGKRVNLGCYGNTPWASMSKRTGFAVIVR